MIVNPDTVSAQMESGIIFGLSAALFGEITLTEGRVAQSNFHDYLALRMNESPAIEFHLVRSNEPPGRESVCKRVTLSRTNTKML